MKKLFAPRATPAATSLALLLLRVALGVAMTQHGWSKIHDPTGWAGDAPPFPEWALAVAAVGEFFGGAGLALGLLTPLSALGVAATMAGAVKFHVDRGDVWVAQGPGVGSFELPLFYLLAAVLFLLIGPGRASLDAVLFGRGAPRA